MTSERGPGANLPRSPARDPLEAALQLALSELESGRCDAAALKAQEVLASYPRDPSALNILGVVALRDGRFVEAKAQFQRALATQPQNHFIHSNAGHAARAIGDLNAARDHYAAATRLRPEFAEGHVHLGDALREMGDLGAAMTAYQAALALEPRLAGALNGAGLVLQRSGPEMDADDHFESALSLRPLGDAGAVASIMANAGCARLRRGHGLDGFEALTEAVRLCPQSAFLWRLLASHLRHTKVVPGSGAFREVLVALLHRADIDAADLATAVLMTLRSDPALADLLDAAADRPDEAVETRTPRDAALAGLLTDPLLLALMAATPVTDIGLEVLLTRVRRRLLMRPAQSAAEGDLPLICALAQQCLLNGFVFWHDEAESLKVETLARELDGCDPRGEPSLWRTLAIAACYRPLQAIAPGLAQGEPTPDAVRLLMTRSLDELATERVLARGVRQLAGAPPQDLDAAAVAYPRWSAADTGDPKPFRAALAAALPHVPTAQLPSPSKPAVLIFGSGAGRLVRRALNSFANAEIVAAEPSALSLAYARRKLVDEGERIEFVQAEAANLVGLGRRFDLVQATGAFDLSAQGVRALSALAACVRPGGLLRLSLHNDFARRMIGPDLLRLDAYLPLTGAAELRRLRRDLITGPHDLLRQWLLSPASDFWTTWDCHRTLNSLAAIPADLSQLDPLLRSLNIEFLTLQLGSSLDEGRYALEFPDSDARSDLASWVAFEQTHPEAFGGTYQLWARKRHKSGSSSASA